MKKNIFAILLMILLVIAIGYVSVGVKNEVEVKIKYISIVGNSYLSKQSYLAFAELMDKENYKNISLQIIKDRFEKHPYIKLVDVRYDGGGTVTVKIKEKVFESILVTSDDQYLLTEEMQVLPVMPATLKIDFPVISNAFIPEGIKVLSTIKKNGDVVTATKIIGAVKLVNPEMYDALSSIDMQNGSDIHVQFSNVDYPVNMGRGNEIKKAIYYSNFWNYLKGKELNNYLEYVDLRYSGHIFLGLIEPNTEETEKKS